MFLNRLKIQFINKIYALLEKIVSKAITSLYFATKLENYCTSKPSATFNYKDLLRSF